MIELSAPRKVDPLELLRPIPGMDSPAGLPPDSEHAPRVEGKNVLIWLASTRNRALSFDEEKAGLPSESTIPLGENESPSRMWDNIIHVSQTYLLEYGKDIRAVFYCVEGWMRRYGPSGLAEGLLLLRGILASYWEWLHPVPPPGAEEDRRQDCLASYFAVSEEEAMEFTPLFLAMNLYFPVALSGDTLVHLGDCLIEGVSRPDVSLLSESVRAAVAETDPALGGQWLEAIREAARECVAYGNLVSSPKFQTGGNPMPSIRKLHRYIEDQVLLLGTLYGRAGVVVSEDGTEEEGDSLSLPVPEVLAKGLLTNKRSDNLRILRALGQCFQRNEPHSPLGYALNHWASLAEKSLPELLDAIGIVDAKERSGLQIFTGVKAPKSTS